MTTATPQTEANDHEKEAVEEIVKLLRHYGSEAAIQTKHARMTVFPKNVGRERWDPRHKTSVEFKEPGKLRIEGACAAMNAMADKIEAHHDDVEVVE